MCTVFVVQAADRNDTRGYADQLWKVSEGLPNSQVRGIAQTTNGLLWVGTVEGVATFDGVGFSLVEQRPLRDMLKQHYIGLATAFDGSVWYSNGQGLSHWRAGKITYYGVTNGLPGAYVLTVFCDRDGRVIAGTDKG